jgi:hypothetical protein
MARLRFVLSGSFMLALATPAAAQEVNDLAAMMAEMGGNALTGKKLRAAIDKAAAEPLGSDKNPVRADGPPGQRAYLARLRCTDGTAPAYERRGNVGPGIYGYIVDLYAVRCGQTESEVRMDMYHRHVEDMPVAGFTIVESGMSAPEV